MSNRSHFILFFFIAVIILKHGVNYARLAEARKTLFTGGESNELEWPWFAVMSPDACRSKGQLELRWQQMSADAVPASDFLSAKTKERLRRKRRELCIAVVDIRRVSLLSPPRRAGPQDHLRMGRVPGMHLLPRRSRGVGE